MTDLIVLSDTATRTCPTWGSLEVDSDAVICVCVVFGEGLQWGRGTEWKKVG